MWVLDAVNHVDLQRHVVKRGVVSSLRFAGNGQHGEQTQYTEKPRRPSERLIQASSYLQDGLRRSGRNRRR